MQVVKVKCCDKISQEQMHCIQRMVDNIEGLAPSDSSVLLEVFEKDGKLCGEMKINSMMLRLKVMIKQINCEKLLNVLDDHCLSQLKKWKEKRKFMQYDYEGN
jgi:hypothetical protein